MAIAKNTIVLPANLHIAVADELKVRAINALATGKNVTLKAAEVQRMDSAAAQILIALKVALNDQGQTLKWEGITPELLSCAQLLGSVEVLGLRTE